MTVTSMLQTISFDCAIPLAPGPFQLHPLMAARVHCITWWYKSCQVGAGPESLLRRQLAEGVRGNHTGAVVCGQQRMRARQIEVPAWPARQGGMMAVGSDSECLATHIIGCSTSCRLTA